MIDYFWEWITRSVGSAVNWFNTFITNSTIAPFIEFFLVVFLIMALIKFIVTPLLGHVGSSDKAKPNPYDHRDKFVESMFD